jgi:hypothetical protein
VTPDQVGGEEEEEKEEDFLRRSKRPIVAATGSAIRRCLLSVQAAATFPWRSWWAALRLPQPGHGAPKTALKRHGGKRPAVAGSKRKRTATPAHARKAATRRV